MRGERILFVNTDERHSEGATDRMLDSNVAAVWGSSGAQGRKLRSRKVVAGDVVYAYVSGMGARARGVVVDGEVYQAPKEQSVFPECTDGDEWHLRVNWTPLPGGGAVTVAQVRSALGVDFSNPGSLYWKADRMLIEHLDGLWGITGRLLPRHWAILCQPSTYNLEAAIAVLEEDTWNLPTGEPAPGDLLVFWKAKGRSSRRGVVALGEVLTRPANLQPCTESEPFWPEGMPTATRRSIWLRYVLPPGAPLWKHDDHQGVFKGLTVANAQGNKLYKVTPEQWDRIVAALGGWPDNATAPTANPVELDRRVSRLLSLRSGSLPKPKGQRNPRKRSHPGGTDYERLPGVKAWVLREAAGTCECCGSLGPFLSDRGVPFLEVHHVHWLASGGPDVIENAVATCPNCHRELHLGAGRGELVEQLYQRVRRLVRPT